MSFSDNFTRADDAHLGSPWTEVRGSFSIVSDQAVATVYDPSSGNQIWEIVSGGGDGTYALTLASMETGADIGIVANYTDINNLILVYCNATSINLYENDAGSFTTLAAFTGSGVTAGDVITLTIAGAAATISLNGTQVCTGTIGQFGTEFGLFAQQGSSGTTAYSDFSFVLDPVSLPFSDNFTRSDSSTLGSPWINRVGTLGIASDQATLTADGSLFSLQVAVATVETGVLDHYAEVVTTSAAKNTMSPIVRLSDANNFIIMDTEQDTGVFDVIAGVTHKLLTISSSPGDTLKLVVSGPVVKAYLNGTLAGVTVTANVTGTKTGMYAYGDNGQSLLAFASDFSTGAVEFWEDDFTRADGALGYPWTTDPVGDIVISSNKAVTTQATSQFASIPLGVDFDIEVDFTWDTSNTISGNAGSYYNGLFGHYLDASHQVPWVFGDPGAGLILYPASGSGSDILSTSSGVPSNGDLVTLRLICHGDDYYGIWYQEGTPQVWHTNFTWEDTSIPVGFWGYGIGTEFSRFRAYDYTSPELVVGGTGWTSDYVGFDDAVIGTVVELPAPVGFHDHYNGLELNNVFLVGPIGWEQHYLGFSPATFSGLELDLYTFSEIETLYALTPSFIPHGSASDLVDYFLSDVSVNPVIWILQSDIDTPTFSFDNALIIDQASSSSIKSKLFYDLTASNFLFNVGSGNYFISIFNETVNLTLYDNTGGASLNGSTVLAGTGWDGGLSVTTPDPWFKVYEDAGTVYLQSSADGESWTARASWAETGQIRDMTVLLSCNLAEGSYPDASFLQVGGFIEPLPVDYQVRRWVFFDPKSGETWTMTKNPNQMTSPYVVHTTTTTAVSPIRGTASGVRANDVAVEWSFQGNITTEAMYNKLVYWVDKPNRIYITDHLGLRWLVWLSDFVPVSKPTSFRNQWRYTYTVKGLVYGRVGQPR